VDTVCLAYTTNIPPSKSYVSIELGIISDFTRDIGEDTWWCQPDGAHDYALVEEHWVVKLSMLQLSMLQLTLRYFSVSFRQQLTRCVRIPPFQSQAQPIGNKMVGSAYANPKKAHQHPVFRVRPTPPEDVRESNAPRGDGTGVHGRSASLHCNSTQRRLSLKRQERV